MIVAVGSLFVMVLATGVMLVLVPRLMPETECFAVTVPHGARKQEPLAGYMRSYARWMSVVVALCALAWPLCFTLGMPDLSSDAGAGSLALLLTVTMCLPLVVSYALMLYFRKLVQAEKADRGWSSPDVRSVAFVGQEDFPKPLPLWVDFVYVPLVVGIAAFALTHYDDFPARMPMHMDYAGTVSSYAPKSLASVLFPAYLTAFLGVVFALCHGGIVFSKKPLDSSAPASSALAYGRFARVMSILLFVGGVLLSAVTAVAYYASALGAMSLKASSGLLMVVTIVFVLAMLFVSFRMGQSGALVAAQSGSAAMPRDDDHFWPLGMFYCNADDPSIFVPKRFGVGWTLNMANRGSWAFIVAFVLLTVLFCWASTALMA